MLQWAIPEKIPNRGEMEGGWGGGGYWGHSNR